MPRILIWPYSNKSKGAQDLKHAIGAQFIKHVNSQYVARPDDLIINWGGTNLPDYGTGKALNHPTAVARACCKTATFVRLTNEGVSTVPWTVDRSVAKGWLNKGKSVVCRFTTTGSGGKGIKIYTPSQSASEALPAAASYDPSWSTLDWLKGVLGLSEAQETLFHLPYAPLYTQYMKKEAEFRVHAGSGKAIHTQMKLRKSNAKEDEAIWNHDNGFSFTSNLEGRISDTILDQVRALGVAAVAALGLDFGAVDIAWLDGKGYVLEVNTAPGMEEPTLSKYVTYFNGIQGAL